MELGVPRDRNSDAEDKSYNPEFYSKITEKQP